MRYRACVGWILALLPGVASAQENLPEMFLGWGSRSTARSAEATSSAPAARPHPSVARIIVPNRDGMSFGSGTLVDVRDQHGLVLTNWHVVNEASDEITVRFPDGFVSGAKLLKADKTWDLAALAIWKPTCSPVPLATRPPQPGDVLSIAGYGHGTYRLATGRCTHYFAPQTNLPQEWVELSVAARQGDSGGPIFNQQGELAGVLFGASSNTTLGSYCGRVQSFLATVLPPNSDTSTPSTQIAARPVGATANQFATTAPNAPPTPSLGVATPKLRSLDDPFAQPIGLNGSLRSNPTAGLSAFESPPMTTSPLTSTPYANRPRANQQSAMGFPERSTATFSPKPNSTGAGHIMSQPSLGRESPKDIHLRNPATSDELSWEQLAGKTPLEQGKTLLAAIGGLSVVLIGLKWLGR